MGMAVGNMFMAGALVVTWHQRQGWPTVDGFGVDINHLEKD
jgi:hypothetical protein